MVVLRGGGLFLMSEVPLYFSLPTRGRKHNSLFGIAERTCRSETLEPLHRGSRAAQTSQRETPSVSTCVQGNFAHKKQRRPGTLHLACAQGPMVVLGGGAVSFERGNPLAMLQR